MLHCVNSVFGRVLRRENAYITIMSTHNAPTRPMKITGIALIVLGVAALLFPLTTGVTLNLFFGVLLAIAGATHFIGSYRAEQVRNRWGHLGLAGAFALIGLLLVFLPSIGVAAFALLLSLAFIIQGGVLIYTSIFAGGGYRYMGLAAGVIGVLAGIIMLANWPQSGTWLVGVLAGVNLIGLGLFLFTTRVDIRRRRHADDDVIDVEVEVVDD